MSTCVILNPNAGSAPQAQDLERLLSERPGTTVRRTEYPHHAVSLASMAARAGYDTVVAAGGDGTTNEVVTGLVESGRLADLTFGIIPLGTGNDLPRTLAIPADPIQAVRLLNQPGRRNIDIIRVEYKDEPGRPQNGVCANVAAGGFSGEVGETLTDELKSRWGPLAYLRGAMAALPELTNYQTTIAYDDGSEEQVHALNIVVASGRTAAGGFAVAPHANPEDGLMDIVVAHTGSRLEIAGVAARLLAGNYVNSDIVSMRRARRVRVTSRPGIWFNVDGELITNRPVTFITQPRALRVIVGPEYRPVVEA